MSKEMLNGRSVFVELRKPNKGIVVVTGIACPKDCIGGPINQYCPLANGLKKDQILNKTKLSAIRAGICKGTR